MYLTLTYPVQSGGRFFTRGNVKGYCFGFNGQMKDDELHGEGNAYSFEYRIHDARIGRFLSVDPLAPEYPHYTPYSFAGNKPIAFVELEGLEEGLPWYLTENKYGGKPVLSLGMPELPTYQRIDYSRVESPSEALAVFTWNTVGAAWNNGIAVPWNEARGGKTGAQMTMDAFNSLEQLSAEDFSKVEMYENIAGTLLVFYFSKKLSPSKSALPVEGGSRKINVKGADYNCAGCSMAGDATLKGFPASALPHGKTVTTWFTDWFKGSKWKTGQSPKSIISQYSQMPDGSTGIVFGNRGTNKMGHFFNVYKSDGKVYFIDFQKDGLGFKTRIMTPEELSTFDDLWILNTTAK